MAMLFVVVAASSIAACPLVRSLESQCSGDLKMAEGATLSCGMCADYVRVLSQKSMEVRQREGDPVDRHALPDVVEVR